MPDLDAWMLLASDVLGGILFGFGAGFGAFIAYGVIVTAGGAARKEKRDG